MAGPIQIAWLRRCVIGAQAIGGPIQTTRRRRCVIGAQDAKNFFILEPKVLYHPGSEGPKIFWFFFLKKNILDKT